MKKILIAFVALAAFSACNNESDTQRTDDSMTTVSPADNTGSMEPGGSPVTDSINRSGTDTGMSADTSGMRRADSMRH